MTLRPATPEDGQRILSWNEADVHFLAPMDEARLGYLQGCSGRVEIIDAEGSAAGFVITFVEGSDYDSENYRWFSEREPRFHYVDRIVVDAGHRGQGHARSVYATLAARHASRPLVAEVNYAPPNPVSLALHKGLGFEEVGRLGGRSYGVVLLRSAARGGECG